MAPRDARVTRGALPQTLTSAPSTTCRHRLPTVRTEAHGKRPTSRGLGAGRRRPTVHSPRTTTRRRPSAVLILSLALVATISGLLSPSTAGAAPNNAAEASKLVREAAQELTVIDEQVHEAEIAVAAQQDAAAAAAAEAAVGPGGAGRLRAAAAGHRPERLHRQEPVAGGRLPHQRLRRRARPADDDAGHDRPPHQRRRGRGGRGPGRRPAGAGRRRPGRPRPPRPASPSSRPSRQRSRRRSPPTRRTSLG